MNTLVAELSFSFALSIRAAHLVVEATEHDRALALMTAQAVVLCGVAEYDLPDLLRGLTDLRKKMGVPSPRIGVLCECGFAWNPPVLDDELGVRFEACPRCGAP